MALSVGSSALLLWFKFAVARAVSLKAISHKQGTGRKIRGLGPDSEVTVAGSSQAEHRVHWQSFQPRYPHRAPLAVPR